ncbi:hypothetical protein VNO77_18121 [Canavalia gladiata]|uniref:CCHC-type domain-containing protein n=1 Tax=Canavalia gladiata TaxID=3824 RepID=A0AAN9LK55_CANGL
MANRPDPDIDDDFRELYKEYTGPLGSATTNAQERAKSNKRSNAGSDEEEEARDPNAVPTDFTSREAKVWEAKSKATERNWKKRKEEEMICKLCGESGHFTQGCPSTLGARKSQDFFERIPARDKHVRALFSEKVISKIERDIGCKIKMDEKFIIVSGKDRLILTKGVDAVHKIREDGDQRGSSSSQMTRSKSPERSPVNSRFQRSEPQRAHSGPRNTSQFQQRFGRQERAVEDRVREDIQKFARGSPQARGKFLAFKHYLRPEGLPPLRTHLLKRLAPMVSLMEIVELEVIQVGQDLQDRPLIQETHIIHLMAVIKIWVLIGMMGGILIEENLVFSLVISLITMPPLRH